MTRKDYVMLAAALARARNAILTNASIPRASVDVQLAGVYEAARRVADALAENPRFDRERFLKACGVD